MPSSLKEFPREMLPCEVLTVKVKFGFGLRTTRRDPLEYFNIPQEVEAMRASEAEQRHKEPAQSLLLTDYVTVRMELFGVPGPPSRV